MANIPTQLIDIDSNKIYPISIFDAIFASNEDQTTLKTKLEDVNTQLSQISGNYDSLTSSVDNIDQSVKSLKEGTEEHVNGIVFSSERGFHGLRIMGDSLEYSTGSEWKKIVTPSSGGGLHIGDSEPSDTNLLWIDTTNSVAKYYYEGSWKPIKATWG